MKHWLPIPLVVVAGVALAWLGVVIPGVASAVSWSHGVAAFAKDHPVLVHYAATVFLYFLPQFFAAFVVGLLLFSSIGARLAFLFGALVPYVLLGWVLGSWHLLFLPLSLFMFGLTVLSVLAIPLGLVLSWLLSRRRALTLPSSGRPPAGFAV